MSDALEQLDELGKEIMRREREKWRKKMSHEFYAGEEGDDD